MTLGSNNEDKLNNSVAIIGMAGRFPGARNIDEFWDNLKNGKDTITHFSEQDLSGKELNYETLKDHPDYVSAKGVIEDVDKFDAPFFGFTPREASLLDPQHRLWLETAWGALESSGYCNDKYDGLIGVYAGSFGNHYLLQNILQNRNEIEKYIRLRGPESFAKLISNDSSYLTTKTSYKLNLKGPSVNVQTACSTSLVAVVMAVRSLLSYESDICIAGGICIALPQETGYIYQEGMIPSRDGHCRPFDAGANGTVFSNGVGAVILKRFEDAVEDSDNILAVIRGAAINNDGSSKVSYMAPSVDSQAEVIAMAQALAEVDASTVTYIEAHGTATPMGDPIEVAGLTKAFRLATDKNQFCGLGSVKSNIGHMDAAAGVAGLIKTVLALQHRQIPPTVHYCSPNPEIDFADSPFYVVDSLSDWKSGDSPRRAGVSSFGIGGTNAHVVLEETPKFDLPAKTRLAQLLPLSGRSDRSLSKATENLVDYLAVNTDKNVSDVAYTLQVTREDFSHRCFAVCGDTIESARKTLVEQHPTSYASAALGDSVPEIAFVFTGQGSHYPGMGSDLYNTEPVFRSSFDECRTIARQHLDVDLNKIFDVASVKQLDDHDAFAQLAIFSLEYSLTKLWEHWGILPSAVLGHSLGEWVAASIAGVFSAEDAILAIYHRGRLMQSVAHGGAAIVIRGKQEDVAEYLESGLSLAAVNSPSICMISGPEDGVLSCQTKLKKDKIAHRRLPLTLAVHSEMMDPIIEPFHEILQQITFSAPKIPIISTVSGDWMTDQQAVDARYWAQHMRKMVRFSDGVKSALADKDYLMLEVGPGTALSTLVKQQNSYTGIVESVNSLSDSLNDGRELKSILFAIGKLWLKGISIDWDAFYGSEKHHKMPLPTYPFEKKRYWIDAPGMIDDEPASESVLPISTESVEVESLKQDDECVDSSEKNTRRKQICDVIHSEIERLSGISSKHLDEKRTFVDYGFDSLMLTQIASVLQERFKVQVRFIQLNVNYPNIEKLSRYIDETLSDKEVVVSKSKHDADDNRLKTEGVEFTYLALLKQGGYKSPFILVYGDNAKNLLPGYLDKDQPFYCFYPQGADGEPIRHKKVEDVASYHISELLKSQPKGPYLLGGFSYGGLVAYEMAVQLIQRGYDIPLIIMIDSFHPEYLDLPNEKMTLLKLMKRMISKPLRALLKRFKDAICKHYLALNKPIPSKYRNHHIVSVRIKSANQYVPQPISCPVVLLRAAETMSYDSANGWGNFARGGLIVEDLPGNHLSMVRSSRNFRILAKHIVSHIDKAQNTPS